MPRLTPEELAVAGHAVALSQWHQVHLAACCTLMSAEWLPAHIPHCLSSCLHKCHFEAAFRCPIQQQLAGMLAWRSRLTTGSLLHFVFQDCSADAEPLHVATESRLLWPLRRTDGADRSRRQAPVHAGEQAPRVPTYRSCGE